MRQRTVQNINQWQYTHFTQDHYFASLHFISTSLEAWMSGKRGEIIAQGRWVVKETGRKCGLSVCTSQAAAVSAGYQREGTENLRNLQCRKWTIVFLAKGVIWAVTILGQHILY